MVKAAQDHIERILSRIWLRQLETMEQHTLAMQVDDNVEKLHQFRVALRQTRALLKLVRRYLPQKLDFFSAEFKWVAGITGAVRDLDVQLIDAAHQLNQQNKINHAAATPLIEALACQRCAAQTQLAKMLTGKRFKKLLSQWKDFISVQLVADLPLKPSVSSAKRIKKIATRQCRRLWQEGKTIKPASSAARLHCLRIRVKRFRYLLLNAGFLFSDRKQQFRQLLKALEYLQSILGAHQDAHKAIFRLQKMLRSKTGKTFSEDTAGYAQRWIESLAGQQQEAHDQFFKAFKLFAQTRGVIG